MELDILPPLTDVRPQRHFRLRNHNAVKPSLNQEDVRTSLNFKKLSTEHSASEGLLTTHSRPIPTKFRPTISKDKLSPFASKQKLEDEDMLSVQDQSEPRSQRLKPSFELPTLNIKSPKASRKAHSVMNKTTDQNRDNLSIPQDEDYQRSVSDNHDEKHHHHEIKSHKHACSDPSTPTLAAINDEVTPNTLIFGTGVTEFMTRRHALAIAQGVRYAVRQVAAPPLSQILAKQVTLRNPVVEGRRTLVLDLDETLISATCFMGKPKLPSINKINIDNSSSFKVHVRPYAMEFVAEMSKEFEVVVFTAAEKEYAENVVKILDPNREYISDIFHREHCLKTKKGYHIKDLRILKDRDLKNMVIVDNLSYSFSFQIDNGIPILSWEGCQDDTELKFLMEYLKEAKTYDDMREFNKEKLQLEKLAHLAPQKFAYGAL